MSALEAHLASVKRISCGSSPLTSKTAADGGAGCAGGSAMDTSFAVERHTQHELGALLPAADGCGRMDAWVHACVGGRA